MLSESALSKRWPTQTSSGFSAFGPRQISSLGLSEVTLVQIWLLLAECGMRASGRSGCGRSVTKGPASAALCFENGCAGLAAESGLSGLGAPDGFGARCALWLSP